MIEVNAQFNVEIPVINLQFNIEMPVINLKFNAVYDVDTQTFILKDDEGNPLLRDDDDETLTTDTEVIPT